ncbi:MAG: histidine phosphatase family protein [Gammaproteobacteria bacterium]|nr:histidine phosphatase family protein [Gammaproteobacteria bacterium]
MKLALLRHGVTDWNLEKRVQGQIDRPLSRLGRQQLAELALPPSLAAYRWYCSPLLRARQTAELLGLKDVLLEPALIEMNWGDWEGKILKPLRRKLGDSMRDNESRGRDFRPPGGESPRQVQSRLRPWLRQVAASERDSAAVVHKGIIRCIYALASGWDMRGESPVDFAWDAIHQFELTPDGELCDSYQAIPLVKI